MTHAELLQYLITGIATGSIYALVAIGFVTIYNVTGILNFAQGEFAMLGALTCISLVNAGFSVPIAALLAVMLTALIGLVMERATIFPLKGAGVLTLIIITIAVSSLLRGVALLIWGTYPKSLPPIVAWSPIQIAGAVLIPQNLLIMLALLVLLAVLYLFFNKTYLGFAVRASETNAKAAQLMGINTASMTALAFTLAAVLGAIAGILIAPITGGMYDMGFTLGLKGFVAMVLGGMTNIPGAVLGGLVIGIVEAFSGGLISTAYSDVISYTILLLVLFFRPTGLFGQKGVKRV